MEKINWMTVVVAVIVAVVAFYLLSAFAPGLSPVGPNVGTGGGSNVNAHECTADGTCEMNNALVYDELSVMGNLVLGEDSIECDVFYGSDDETCINNGFDYCLIEEHQQQLTYYNSTDRSNSGIQTEIKTPYLTECGNTAGGGSGGFNSDGSEPYFGDFDTTTVGESRVVCCR